MDPEELAAALAQAPEQGAQSRHHGRRARLANGAIVVWQEAPNGRGGRFVEMSEATAPPEARRAMAADRAQLGVLAQIAPMAERHNRVNQTAATGGARQRAFARASAAHENPNADRGGWNFMAGFLTGPERAQLQTMRGLESEAAKASIMPGQGGQANTLGEQQLFRGRFPDVSLRGAANQERTAALFVSRDLQRARVAAAEQWLRRYPDLSGFTEAWAQQEARLRPQLEARYALRFGARAPVSANPGATIGASIPPVAPQSTQRLRWNPQTQQLEPVR